MTRTIPDWLKHATAATDPAETDRCIDQAISQAESCFDWRTILRGLWEPTLARPERLIEVAHRTLERAIEERQIWGFCDVATTRATRLGDELGARAALERCVALFLEPSATRGYEWVLLGRAFQDTLHDDIALRRCLEAGRDAARVAKNADDLCSIAQEWASRVDRPTGISLLLEAEAMAINGSARPWTLANAWHALGESEAVHRVLGRALQTASECSEAIHVASAWASHHEVDQTRRALVRAQELASTAEHWLSIAESAFDLGLGEEPLRHAVTRAEAMVCDDEQRARVSNAYKLWLHDHESASRVGPAGFSPEALRHRVRSLPGWGTSASGLFDWLRARATRDTLEKIASADYAMHVEKHLAALMDICETGLIPRHLQWEPHEVLALTRWSTGEQTDHLQRALSCVILCIAPGELDELTTNGAILAESCLALGGNAPELAEQFFAWRSETEEFSFDSTVEGDIGPDEPVALLLLFVLRVSSAPDDPRLIELARRLTHHPEYTLESVAQWIADSMSAQLWNDLIERLLVPFEAGRPFVASVLRGLGRLPNPAFESPEDSTARAVVVRSVATSGEHRNEK